MIIDQNQILPIVFHPHYVTALPPGHRFPMEKFGLIKDKLIEDKVILKTEVSTPQPATLSQLSLAHEDQYIEKVIHCRLDKSAERRLGFPCTPEIVRRSRAAVGGTILTSKLALQYGIACNTAGGSHHSHPGHAAGFCVFNDVAVAIKTLQYDKKIKQALVVDLDVHQGDGTACFFRDDPSVFTFSIHCEDNYPIKKQVSDLDIGLPKGVTDEDYIKCLATNLPIIIHKSKPDIVFFNAGVDVHKNDKLGNFSLSNEGIQIRDWMTIKICLDNRIPIACVIGGGYETDINQLIYRHTIVYRSAQTALKELIDKNKNNTSILQSAMLKYQEIKI